LQGLSLLARSVLKHQTAFFLAFLDHVFLSVNNIRVVWDFFLMASSVEVPANLIKIQAYFFVGFEVFTAVAMKSIIFCDMTPCSPLSVNRRFRDFLLNLFIRP
jgi:hypothetical protein